MLHNVLPALDGQPVTSVMGEVTALPHDCGITPEELEAWKRLDTQATPGPWEWDTATDHIGIGWSYVRTPADDKHPSYYDHPSYDARHHDAAFIAAARAAVPRLIEEVERLREQRSEQVATTQHVIERMSDQRKRAIAAEARATNAEAEVERLRAKIEKCPFCLSEKCPVCGRMQTPGHIRLHVKELEA